MDRLLFALAIVVVAALVSELVRRRRRSDPPTQTRSQLPSHLDRTDFTEPGADWLVVVFTSATCSTCADVIGKAEVLRSADLAVEIVSYQESRELHERYAIDAVPCLVIVDRAGLVHVGFIGPVTATDLWAAAAEVREPGSIDRTGGCDRHEQRPGLD
jgi:hypothetical protein